MVKQLKQPKRINWHFVYLLKCSDRTLYCGSTNNFQRRLREHNKGTAARYTRGRLPVKLVYLEKHSTLLSARGREQEIKGWTKRKKLTLIKDNAHESLNR
ncbi:MAG: GIY-YIG nuclease family protein [Patescibacteria group bacterium]